MWDFVTKKKVGADKLIQKSFKSWHIQTNSLEVATKVLYSASTEERAIVDCFLDFQETKESPKKTEKPVIDFLVLAQEAQSMLESALNYIEEDEAKNNPWPGLALR